MVYHNNCENEIKQKQTNSFCQISATVTKATNYSSNQKGFTFITFSV